MSFANANDKKDGKKGNKNAKGNLPGSKSFIKPGKAGGFGKKPPKTGGTRGS